MLVIWNNVATFMTVIFGAASAFCWLRSARVEVAARPGTDGVGALLGGDIVIRNAAGKRIDLIDTMEMQCKWNRRAAIFATIAATSTAVQAWTNT